MLKQLFVASIFTVSSLHAHAAALMGFEDSFMLMTETGEYNQELMINYAPSVRHAFGVEVMRMSPKGERATTMTGVNYTGLLKRWNMPSAQANLWFMGSVGEATGQFDGFSYSPSVQFDYESTRLYFLAKVRAIRAPEMNNDTAAMQAGFSFYETGFDETQPWFVLEAKTTRNYNPSMQVTPALRLINKHYFVEIGVTNPFLSSERAARLNLMFTY
jgi:hypothetical protein